MTPTDYLNQIIDVWTPERDARSAVSAHRARIEQQLESDLGILRMRETGSWHHGTALDVWSDVDYFVTMSGSRPTDSQSSLNTVLASLRRGFPQALIYANRPAVSVRVSDVVPVMEIVPAFYRQTDDYDIPDPTGSGWIRSNPAKHLEYVNQAQHKDSKTKRLIRLIKIWRHRNSVPISSIYLEMRAAKRVTDVPPVMYLWDLTVILEEIASGALAAMNDPSEYDGRRIQPGCANATEQASALAEVTNGARLSRLAKEADEASNDALAVYYIKQLLKL
jgi:hypothetical protein